MLIPLSNPGTLAPTIFVRGDDNPANYTVMSNARRILMTVHRPSGRALPCVTNGGVTQNAAESLLSAGTLGKVQAVAAVANLAVGVYTAYQVTKARSEQRQQTAEIRADIASMLSANQLAFVDLRDATEQVRREVGSLQRLTASAFSRVEAELACQSRMLGLLLDGQRSFAECLDAAHASLVLEIRDQAAHREQLEFTERLLRLQRGYGDFQAYLDEGVSAPERERERVIEAAHGVFDWMAARARGYTVGSPERVPLLAAQVFATTVERDVRELFDENDPVARRRVRAMCDALAEEASGLVSTRSPYELAVPLAPVLQQYVALYTGLSRGAADLVLEDGKVERFWPLEALFWADGLDALRAAVTPGDKEPLPQDIALRTIDDMIWYSEWTEAPRAEFDVHSVRATSRAAVLSAVGIPPELEVYREAPLHEFLRTMTSKTLMTPTVDSLGRTFEIDAARLEEVRAAVDLRPWKSATDAPPVPTVEAESEPPLQESLPAVAPDEADDLLAPLRVLLLGSPPSARIRFSDTTYIDITDRAEPGLEPLALTLSNPQARIGKYLMDGAAKTHHGVRVSFKVHQATAFDAPRHIELSCVPGPARIALTLTVSRGNTNTITHATVPRPR